MPLNMKNSSASSDRGKKQSLNRFLTINVTSKDQKDPIRELSTYSESEQRPRQPSWRRGHRWSSQNSKDSSVYQPSRSQNVPDEVPGLADLIWQYFEPQIREALLEAQETLGDDNDNRSEQLSNGKRVGK